MAAEQEPAIEFEKRSPSVQDLLAWFIWEKLLYAPISEYDEPATIAAWIYEFRLKKCVDHHNNFYNRYERFVDLFCSPEESDGSY